MLYYIIMLFGLDCRGCVLILSCGLPLGRDMDRVCFFLAASGRMPGLRLPRSLMYFPLEPALCCDGVWSGLLGPDELFDHSVRPAVSLCFR